MIYLPLHYSRVIVARAIIDDEYEPLTGLYWTCSLPGSLRRIAANRPDVMVAMIREEPTIAHRITPDTHYGCKVRVLLAHIVLRPMIYGLFLGKLDSNEPRIDLIKSLRAGVGRVVYDNSNRCDCRRLNLKEITDERHLCNPEPNDRGGVRLLDAGGSNDKDRRIRDSSSIPR